MRQRRRRRRCRRYPDTERLAENPIFFPDQFASALGALAALAWSATEAVATFVSQAGAVINHLSSSSSRRALFGSVGAQGNRSPLGAVGCVRARATTSGA
jgi:hypothetical protein